LPLYGPPREFCSRCRPSAGNFETGGPQERIQIIADVLVEAVEGAVFFLRQYTIAAEWRQQTCGHLLHAGVDINPIRAWLGHVSLDTTNVYAETDLEMKATALAPCEVKGASKPTRRRRQDAGLMAFLKSL
jgi:hypothetical protein